MNTSTADTQQHQDAIILTTGMFDLLKEQIRRKKLSPFNEAKLVAQLRTAQQVIRRDLPENIVDVNTLVRLTDKDTNE